MGKSCDIEYVDSSCNAQMGCDGCELWVPKNGVEACYAGQVTERYAGQQGWPISFDQPVTFIDRIDKALRWPDLTGKDRPEKPHLNGLPRIIFLDDMGDTYTESLPLGWLREKYDAMAESPHIWLFLTKRPNRMARDFQEYGRIPDNFWLGTTYTSRASAGRLKALEAIPARHKWISYEPMWGPPMSVEHGDSYGLLNFIARRSFDWIVSGGESGKQAKPFHISWPFDVRDECAKAGVAFFWKQNGEFIPKSVHDFDGDDWRTRKDLGVIHWDGSHDGVAFGDDENSLVLPYHPDTVKGGVGGHLVQRVGKKAGGQDLSGDFYRAMPISAEQPYIIGGLA